VEANFPVSFSALPQGAILWWVGNGMWSRKKFGVSLKSVKGSSAQAEFDIVSQCVQILIYAGVGGKLPILSGEAVDQELPFEIIIPYI